MHGREQVLVDKRLGCGAARCGIFAGGAARRLLSQHVERREAAPPALFFGLGLALRLHFRLAHSLGLRSPARFFFLPAAPLRLLALARFLLFIDLARKGIKAREKVRRGRTRAGGIAGVVGHPLSPKGRFPGRTAPGHDAANDTLPRPTRARRAVLSAALRSVPERVALRRRVVAVLLVERRLHLPRHWPAVVYFA